MRKGGKGEGKGRRERGEGKGRGVCFGFCLIFFFLTVCLKEMVGVTNIPSMVSFLFLSFSFFSSLLFSSLPFSSLIIPSNSPPPPQELSLTFVWKPLLLLLVRTNVSSVGDIIRTLSGENGGEKGGRRRGHEKEIAFFVLFCLKISHFLFFIFFFFF